MLKYLYNLSDEEFSVVQAEIHTGNLAKPPKDASNLFFTAYTAADPTVSGDELLKRSKFISFNLVTYLSKMKLSESVFTNQFEVLKTISSLDDEGLLRNICERRTLPINIMKLYRNSLPWDLLYQHKLKGWLTPNKVREFRKELDAYEQSIK